jgi:predicted SAM-dependent methyltransferase
MGKIFVFASDALVRFKNGKILIHTTSSARPAFECENPMLVGWLCQFSKPTDADRALGALSPADCSAASDVIGRLCDAGTLVRIGSPEAGPATPEQSAIQAKRHMRLLARSVYELSCDILGLGPHGEAWLESQTGIGTERRLIALLAAVDGFRSELNSGRGGYLEQQLRSLGVTPESSELKLHIGCGPHAIPGWINLDIYPAPLSMNVMWGLPFSTGSARYVFVSHLLEHLYFPLDVQALLKEIRRVLAPGGIVRVVVPDIEQCIEAYHRNDRAFFASRRETWSWWPENPTRLEDFLAYAGAGAEPTYLFESHKYGYDFETLERALQNQGFTNITRSNYMESAHDALRVDHASAVAKAMYGDRYYSLFVEASADQTPKR